MTGPGMGGRGAGADRPAFTAARPAFQEARRSVRGWLRSHAPSGHVCVGLSGGADSLALTAAAVAETRSAGGAVTALVVDHRLQDGSAEVARRAAEQAMDLGCADARVLAVDVSGPGGAEAAARRARYSALDGARGGLPVLLAHTLDDQAETVLLGLGRGSGARSIRGMAEWSAPWGRPLLGIRRTATRQVCRELGLDVWDDPHNEDPRFARVRVRRGVLPLLEDVLGGGVAEALARTARQLREDDDALEESAGELAARAGGPAAGGPAAGDPAGGERGSGGLDARILASGSPSVRRRVLRHWLPGEGVTGLTDARLRRIDDLVARWRGQGPVAVGGGAPDARLVVLRQHGRLAVVREAITTVDERS